MRLRLEKNRKTEALAPKKSESETNESEENTNEVVIRVMLKAAVAGAIAAMEHEIAKIKVLVGTPITSEEVNKNYWLIHRFCH